MSSALPSIVDTTKFKLAQLPVHISSEKDSSKLTFGNNEPQKAQWDDSSFKIIPVKKTDFWQKTYYTPCHQAANGHIFGARVLEKDVTIETKFTLHAQRQFDQAGVVFYLDKDYWIKAGIEHVDGKNKMSVVVTNAYSDWSTQDWDGDSLHIRLHIFKGKDAVVECMQNNEWKFMRIAHIGEPVTPAEPCVGVYSCCPNDEALGHVLFHSISVTKAEPFHHTF